MTTNEPKDIINIPQIENYDLFERNRDKAYDLNENHCPRCGKMITNPKYFINSIYGGMMYPALDKNEYADAWVMGIGSECRKKFPEGYVFTLDQL